MPAEWEPHAATWLAWPSPYASWSGRDLDGVEKIYAQMIAALLPGERADLLVADKTQAEKAIHLLALRGTAMKNLFLHRVKTADVWIRDYGPIFVKSRKDKGERIKNKAFVKWIFNAWGGKYPYLVRDNRVVDQLTMLKAYRRFDPGIVLEGGSIDVDGRGTCLSTEPCLLNKNRNPRLTRQEIEATLRRYLGIQKTIWLTQGIAGDDTDAHIDNLARFVGQGRILAVAGFEENLKILKQSTDVFGRKLKVAELPQPGHVGGGLPASYANFYIGNSAVLVPVYSHGNDKKALRIIRRCFPGRRVVAIECTALVHGLGSIHCVTQQEPR